MFPRTKKQALKYENKFWNKQPVSSITSSSGIDGLIKDYKIEDISKNPINLPEGYTWETIDIKNKKNRKEIANFLDKYYVEDVTSNFRLSYSADFLKWSLIRPNFDQYPDLCFAIRLESENRPLIGFISGIIIDMQINSKTIKIPEVNFLCVHPKLRKKNFAPILIEEMTRRVFSYGFFYAIYTGERYIHKPIGTVKYYHRPLNIKPLLKTGFTATKGSTTAKDLKEYFKLSDKPKNENFVEMQEEHIEEAFNCLRSYLERYNIYEIFSLEGFRHIFYNNKFTTSYVLLQDGKVIDFISYYSLPSKIINGESKCDRIHTAYLYYYTSNIETPFRLIQDMMIVAKNKGFHVFNALNIMEHSNLLTDLKFEEGTGVSHYFLYNIKCRELMNKQIAKILF